MLVFEAKLEGDKQQYERLDEAIRTARFIRNSCIRHWMDNQKIGRYELSAYCKVLAQEFPWANKLNSMARQASAERAWSAIARFYDNCKKKVVKKGFPRFKKERTQGSVEYKTCGWKLSEDRRTIAFTDGFKAGSFRMWGTRDLHFYQLEQIKRVRVVRRADGYYVQFCLDVERVEKHEPTSHTIGLDVGLSHFYTDSDGKTVKKSLSTRTHQCHHCGFVLDRDWNAALNILELALRTVGHTGTLNASGDIDLCIGDHTPQCKPSRGMRKPKERSLESPTLFGSPN
jgi:putative transposase